MSRREEALDCLRLLCGDPRAEFRAGQWEAVEELVDRRARLLLVQRTGWGKSLVYFLATRLLRTTGKGGTWTGAVEALKRGERPVYFRPEGLDRRGRAELTELGALAWPPDATDDLSAMVRPAG